MVSLVINCRILRHFYGRIRLTVPQDAAARPYKAGEDIRPGATRTSRMQ